MDGETVIRFCDLIGLDPTRAWFRSIHPAQRKANRRRRGSDLQGLDLEELNADAAQGSLYVVIGEAETATGSLCAVRDADVSRVGALFIEWDDRPVEWQLNAWRELGLPVPTVSVTTGGKSVHHYWRLQEPAAPAEWREAITRLIAHAGSDPRLKNPGRIMRLPGSPYWSRETGTITGRCELAQASGCTYSLAELMACLPAEQQEIPRQPPSPPAPRLRVARSLQEIEEAARFIPPRVGGEGTYDRDRNALCGCSAALAEAGCPDPEGRALELLGHLWPSRGEAWQVLGSTTTREAASFWAIARENGYDLQRHGGEQRQESPKPRQQKAERPTFEEQWRELEREANEIHARCWPGMKATAALNRKARDLDLTGLTTRSLEQLLEAAQRRARPAAEPVMPGGLFEVAATPWAVDGIFRQGLNLLVGQAGAGKSRMAAALMAAWLRGDRSWLNRELCCRLAAEQRHALIVGTDQPLEDWAITLEPVGLAERVGAREVRIHPRVTLHPLETGTLLDADGIATIRRWVDAHPDGMVLVDSLSACLPPGIDEDKPAAARPVMALQEAISGGWGIITHHTRKGAGKEGNLGVGAGRGSSAIDGAVSRVVGLGLIHRMENGVKTPQEADPRRELLSTKRGGPSIQLIVRSDGSGFWSNEGDAAELKRQERLEAARCGLTEAQEALLTVIEDADGWLTTREVVEQQLEDGETYDAKSGTAATVRTQLTGLAKRGLIQAQRVGNQQTYRAIPSEVVTEVSEVSTGEFGMNRSLSSPVAAQGISPAHFQAHYSSPEHSERPPAPGAGGEPVGERSERGEPVGEPRSERVKPVALQQVSEVSDPSSPAHHLAQLAALRREHPGAHAAELALLMDPGGTGHPTGRQVKAWLTQLDSERGEPAGEPEVSDEVSRSNPLRRSG